MPRNRRLAFSVFLLSLAVVFGFATSSAFAADPPATSGLAKADHYCIACHSAGDARLTAPMAWRPSGAAALSPCPTVRQLWQEMIYTDQAFDAIANGGPLDQRTLARAESISRLVETSYRSVDAGVNQARLFRYQLNKGYSQIQTGREASNLNIVLIVGVAVSIILLGSLAWGLWNTRHLTKNVLSGFRIRTGAVLFLLFIFMIFALPIFNPPVQSAVSTAADLERQAAIDAATRAAESAENESAKAWGLARLVASASPPIRPLAITASLSTTHELEINAYAYWGRARAVEESAVTWEKAPEAAIPLAQRIQVGASRAWTFAAIADEISRVDAKSAASFLTRGLTRAQANPDPYFRSLDMRKLAIAWAELDRPQALAVATRIDDPFIRAWALRELGAFDLAAASARQVMDLNQRVFALGEVAAASGDPALLDEALSLAGTLPEPARAYALSELVTSPQMAQSISSHYPAARAIAFRRLGQFEAAWSELEQLQVGWEQARAESELVAMWAKTAPDAALTAAGKIRDPFWRAEAQRAATALLARTDSAQSLERARGITIPFVRVQAMTDIAEVTGNAAIFPEATALADQLHDPYALRDLAIAWAAVEPTLALTLVDKLDNEADRAQVLLAVSLKTKDTAVFDRAVKQAQAARMLGDPLYSSELLRELGTGYAAVDPVKAEEAFRAALDAAQKVTTAF